ncbi:UvrD-helicase domain-containing protein [Candidatus Pacearchaeota archaeon]|nr:UvrD-helicase domain-containing protein [Candidatus Pacearchaeota archaeon]
MDDKSGLIKEFKRDDSLDYLKVLKALKEIPFPVGKNLLIDFLKGVSKNASIRDNDLNSLSLFGSFKKDNLKDILDNLINNSLIESSSADFNKFIKVLRLTERGKQEISNPQLYKNKIKNNFNHSKTIITEEDEIKFKELNILLEKFNDYQKKAIISENEKILCIAGAGSGKTTVLTKRIEFLVKYKGINPNKILAITFTRKAREEMQYRLVDLGINTNVETFNSFSEKILLKHENQIYGRKMNVISYGNKVMAIMSALSDLGLTMNQVIEIYFSDSQRRNKTSEQLSNTLMNDCFFILEYFKSRNDEFYDFSEDAFGKDKPAAKTIYNICKHLKKYMDLSGLRDYTDQIIETIKFFESNKQYIPEFEYVLVDEYQDVNSMQIKLLNLLKPKNLFCVGDPRQSIFGWRGSDINYILKFQEKYPESEIITLIKNYRSTNHLVNLMNSSIRIMSLPDLENSYEDEKKISLLNFDSEEKEMNFVISEILSSDLSKDDIFVLSRTNYQLTELSKFMKQKNIPHILKTDDFLNGSTAKKGEVTLATIHSIKGLEAHKVFIIGCNEINFPCKASDHPVIEMIKIDNYDKEEEERRLFYVAISRAKKELFLTYTGKKPTYFINSEMLKIISGDDF